MREVESSMPVVLAFSGSLSYENAHEVTDATRQSLLAKPCEVVIELGDVGVLDSSGLRALLQSRRLCEEAGTKFRIGSTSECVSRVIGMSGLCEVFELPDAYTSAAHGATIPRGMEQRAWKVEEHVATSDASIISGLRDKVAKAAIEAGASGEALCDIQIAAGEALTNAYRHGSPNKGVDRIRLRCFACPEALLIEVEDEGTPFDPDSTSEPDPKQMRDHGMGIYLMRQAMDVVEFESGCPGNKIRMLKWLKPLS